MTADKAFPKTLRSLDGLRSLTSFMSYDNDRSPDARRSQHLAHDLQILHCAFAGLERDLHRRLGEHLEKRGAVLVVRTEVGDGGEQILAGAADRAARGTRIARRSPAAS